MPCLTTGHGGDNAAEAVKVEDMMLLVDTILENSAADDEKVELCTILKYSRNIITAVFRKHSKVLSKVFVEKYHCLIFRCSGAPLNTL